LIVLLPASTPTNLPTASFENEVIGNLSTAGLTNSIPFYQNMFKLFNNAPGASKAQDILPPGATLATPTVASVPTPDGCSDYLPTTLLFGDNSLVGHNTAE